MTLLGAILSLNPHVDRDKYLIVGERIEETLTIDDNRCSNLMPTYFLSKLNTNNHFDLLRQEILNLVYSSSNAESFMSSDVANNSLRILDKLPVTSLEKLDVDNVYLSNNGTIVLDWEGLEYIVSVEIGKKSYGYYVEKNGVDVKQVDSISFVDGNIDSTTNDLILELDNL